MITCPNCKSALEVKVVAATSIPGGNGQDRTKVDVNDVGDLIQSVDVSQLNDYEAEFIASTRERYAQYQDRIKMSPKQMAILRKIAAEKSF